MNKNYVFALVPPDKNWEISGYEKTKDTHIHLRGWWSVSLIKTILEERGCDFRLAHEYSDQELKNVDFFLFENSLPFHYKYYRKLVRWGMEYKAIYFMMEPEVVLPWHCVEKVSNILKYYAAIFTWRPDIYTKNRCFETSIISLPNSNIIYSNQAFSQRKLITMISVYSEVHRSGELYSERRRLAKWFEDNHPEDFDLYGRGWPNYQCYKGVCGNKQDVYHKYKFAITLENSVCEGYFEEKMISAWQSGVVPIYKGARDIHQLIPYDCFIDYDEYIDDGGEERLYKYLTTMTEERYNMYLLEAKKALELDVVKKRMPSYWCNKLIEMADVLYEQHSFHVSKFSFFKVQLLYTQYLIREVIRKTLWAYFIKPIIKKYSQHKRR